MPQPSNSALPVEPAIIGDANWDNTVPILREVRQGLRRLADTGEPSLIDLSAPPFLPSDEQRLLSILGGGEIEAELDALGPTRVWESSLAGVWLVDHRDAQDQRLALHIEITKIPQILCAQPYDIEEAIPSLDARIAECLQSAEPSSS